MNRFAIPVVVVVGILIAAALAGSLGMPTSDTIRLIGLSASSALAVGTAGGLILFALRRHSVGLQAALAALTTAVALGVGAVVASTDMFLSEHDLNSLLVVLAAAGAIGIAIALWLGARVARAGTDVGDVIRRVGSGEMVEGAFKAHPREFATLGNQLKETAARLEESRTRERAMERSRRELVSWVSHDLRTPLSGIRAMAEALEDGIVDDPDDVSRYHRMMREETDRLARLVDDLFELSRVHSGTLNLTLERASLSDIVSDAISASSALARTKDVRLEGEKVETLELELSTAEITRVLRNLLDNAIRHTPKGGTVRVEAGAESGHAFVAVRDSCGGIPDADIGRVFDVAFRGAAARTPGDGGAGLGLAIARGIVEAHRGDLAVSNVADGCEFTMRLPLRKEPVA